MKNIDLIAESVEIIEKNIKENITVLDISQKLGYSYYHFSRLFKGVTGHAPSDYILRRRLSKAAKELITSSKKVIEIAYDYQFNSPEAFSRSFKKMFSITPLNMRKQKDLAFFQVLNRINVEAIHHTQQILAYEPEEVELDAFTVVGMTCLMINTEPSLITRIWEKFLTEIDQIPNRVVPENHYQICFWPDAFDLGGIFLMAGVEIKDKEIHNQSYVLKTIPAGRYLKFIHKGFANKVGLTYRYIYQTFLPQTEYRLSQPFNFEYYGEKCLGPYDPDSESEVYIPVE